MSEQPATRERRPITFGWNKVPFTAALRQALPGPAWLSSLWIKGRCTVVSSLGTMEYPSGGGGGPTWLISISTHNPWQKMQVRPALHDVRMALDSFEMRQAEEDNHEPGVSRKFFLVVDPARRVDCECKTSETLIREADGYTWTNPKSGPCRGCGWAQMRRALGYKATCPIHREAIPDGQ